MIGLALARVGACALGRALADYRTAPARAILSVTDPHTARCARRAYEVGADRWQHDDLNRHGLAHVAAWADDALRAVSL